MVSKSFETKGFHRSYRLLFYLFIFTLVFHAGFSKSVLYIIICVSLISHVIVGFLIHISTKKHIMKKYIQTTPIRNYETAQNEYLSLPTKDVSIIFSAHVNSFFVTHEKALISVLINLPRNAHEFPTTDKQFLQNILVKLSENSIVKMYKFPLENNDYSIQGRISTFGDRIV